jgi:transcriptional regulator with XRE-family HTH domain
MVYRGPSMAKRKIQHEQIVRRFAARLRELRLSRGMTQVELARSAQVTVNYVGRLEAAGAAPGIDLVGRLADALGTTAADLLPATDPPDTDEVLRRRAREMFDALIRTADRESMLTLIPLLARFGGSADTSR